MYTHATYKCKKKDSSSVKEFYMSNRYILYVIVKYMKC